MIGMPGEIERRSMAIIKTELNTRGILLSEKNEAVILRCIHASADFDYAENLHFTSRATELGVEALRNGRVIVTDTNMALAGISRPGLQKLGSKAFCYMAEPNVAEEAKSGGTTRAAAAMQFASERHPKAVFAVGNAPTALLRLTELMAQGLRPALIIAVPVGFVNVTESKKIVFSACEKYGVPCIAAMGQKGGSSIAAAICNALIYTAAELLEPASRGWN